MAIITGLRSYWKMDDAAGDLVDSHAGHNASNHGADYSQAGKINTSMLFVKANSDYAHVPNHADLVMTNNMSISLWYKPASTTTNAELINKRINGTGTVNYVLRCQSDNKLLFFFWDTPDGYWQTASTLLVTDGVWNHIVVTYDDAADQVTYYINGVHEHMACDKNMNTNAASDLFFGAMQLLLNFADGNMDEIGLWAKTLTEAEVAELYNAGNGLAYPFANGIKINIGDAWKQTTELKINIGDSWKTVNSMKINIGDSWKTIF